MLSVCTVQSYCNINRLVRHGILSYRGDLDDQGDLGDHRPDFPDRQAIWAILAIWATPI